MLVYKIGRLAVHPNLPIRAVILLLMKIGN